ncbi:MAG: radical SAM protein, partial [Isosphaeraceae bacterium]|nr:radical SAM protein [Isosphaeraceae bacterium]
MELPRRPKGDRYTTPGRYRELEARIRWRVAGQRVPALVCYAFDLRTRLGPYVFIDTRLIPGAPRAVASALHAAGFEETRVVLQQWCPRIRPSLARLDGRPPELLLVSSMQIHSAAAYRLIADAWELGEHRPLILAGGAKAIYEPWDFFGLGPDGRRGADVVVTGEEFVLLELLDRLLDYKAEREPLRAAFRRARAAGALEDIPGLVYRRDDGDGPPRDLVNTGVQRLVQDLDELPLPFDALGLFEPPHRRATLKPRPIPPQRLGRYAKVLAIITTHGCKFHCPYCPIPAYNQDTFRFRSPERLVSEIAGTVERTGIASFFGTDDNFFNSREAAREILAALARGVVGGRPFREAIWFGTEATEFDVDRNLDLLPLARDGGLRAIWFGIEDLTAGLVKKGQSPEKTERVFRTMLANGIAPMPMLMHHDGQPLRARDGLAGLLDQVHFLRRAGAVSIQVTFLTPAAGTKGYETPYREGLVLGRVGGREVSDHQFDGNHCIATRSARPWQHQLNILLGYASFYNPVHALRALLTRDTLWKFRLVYQLFGNLGVLRTAWASAGWLRRLLFGRIERRRAVPTPKFRM